METKPWFETPSSFNRTSLFIFCLKRKGSARKVEKEPPPLDKQIDKTGTLLIRYWMDAGFVGRKAGLSVSAERRVLIDPFKTSEQKQKRVDCLVEPDDTLKQKLLLKTTFSRWFFCYIMVG